MKILPGLNIQFPISRLILSGKKTVETRLYSLPKKYIGKDLLLIETPGSSGTFEARIVGLVRFSECFQYKSKKQFYEDQRRHFVDASSPYAWKDKKKWGWLVEHVEVLPAPILAPKRKGIRFTQAIAID